MSALDPEAGAPGPAQGPGAARGRRLRAALPHVITGAVAVAITIAAVALMRPATSPPAQVAAPTSAPPTPAPTARPAAPAPSAPPLAEGITQQELADIRAEADRKQAQIYLLLAIVQIDDAQAALRVNELPSVDQSLVAIDNSLNLAYARYERAGDSARDAVAQRRMEVGKLHDDLYLYPEGMDLRLNTLRQLTLALITEQR
ncbi:MAG: hypothetical protein IPO81_12230 [Kouleothrix sp.]|nr:hypothetical protein [Kouleothrix sp.]